jgi:hypothetical protein
MASFHAREATRPRAVVINGESFFLLAAFAT